MKNNQLNTFSSSISHNVKEASDVRVESYLNNLICDLQEAVKPYPNDTAFETIQRQRNITLMLDPLNLNFLQWLYSQVAIGEDTLNSFARMLTIYTKGMKGLIERKLEQ